VAKRIFIRDLQASQFIEGVYAIQNCQLGQTKGGKPYIRCLLADRTGRTPGRMWNASEELFRGLPTDGFVFIEGQTQPYQGEMQIIIQQIGAVDPSEDELLDLLPTTQYDIAEMFSELQRILEWVKHPPLRALLDAYLNDEALMANFKQAPAAQSLHHAFLGGLLEHTLSVLRIGEVLCPLYRQVNQDVVLTGLFLHDLGKCGELTWKRGLGYSDDGQLVGHIARGAVWLNDKARACADGGTPIPEVLLRVLEHIILSHHGQPEFGALKIPATPEAIMVSMIDNLDAKMHMAIAATRDADLPGASGSGEGGNAPEGLGGSFTEKVWALGTRLYRPDPTRVQ
jgi:3'-5' exoribonuclease